MDRRTRPTSYASLPIEHYPAFAFTTFGDDQWPVTYQLTSRVIPLKCHCTTTRPDLNKKIQTHTLFVRNSSGAQSVFGAGGIQPTSVTAPPSLANRSEKVVRLALQLPFMAKSFRRSFLCCAPSSVSGVTCYPFSCTWVPLAQFPACTPIRLLGPICMGMRTH